ncbi:hypothetical protein [Geodermatophilus sp. SYSU D01105]
MAGNVFAATSQDAERLLRSSGGRPTIQIVFDIAEDVTSIQSAGLDGADVVRFLIALGRSLERDA